MNITCPCGCSEYIEHIDTAKLFIFKIIQNKIKIMCLNCGRYVY